MGRYGELARLSGGEYEAGRPRALRPWVDVWGTVVVVTPVPSPLTSTLIDENGPELLAVGSKCFGCGVEG